MKLQKWYLWLLVAIIIVIGGLIAFREEKTIDMDVKAKYFNFDQFVEYYSEAQALNERQISALRERISQSIQDDEGESVDEFIVLEFIPKTEDEVLDRITFFARINDEGKIYPIERESFYFKEHNTNKYRYECLYNMTFDLSTANQIAYKMEGQIVTFRKAGGPMLYEDDLVTAKRVNKGPDLESKDIFLSFDAEGIVKVAR